MKNRLTFTLLLLLAMMIFLPLSFGQEFNQWGLPKDVKARIGKGWIMDMAFSPDGNQLAVATSIGIWLYNINTGTEVAFLNGHTEWVSSVAFSPDGKTLVSGSYDWTVRVWDIENGKHIKTLKVHNGVINSVAYSPDGNTFASGGVDGIRLWNVEDWNHQHIFQGRLAKVSSLVYSPDGKVLTSGCRDGRIHFWDAANGGHKKTIQGHKRINDAETNSLYFIKLKYSPDGTTLASLSNGELLFYDPINKESILTVESYKFNAVSLAFSLNGNTIFTGNNYGAIDLWDSENTIHKRSLEGHTDRVTSVVHSPNDNIYASGSYDGTIRLWGAVVNLPKRLYTGHTRYVACIMFSPDSKTLASGGMNSDVHIWDAETGKYLRTFSEPGDVENTSKPTKGHATRHDYPKLVTSLAFSPNGYTLASGSMDNKIRIWEVKNREYLGMLDPHIDEPSHQDYMDDVRHTHAVRSLAYSPDGKILASGSKNGKIRLWDPKRGWWLKTLKVQSSPVTAIAFSPDGKTFTSAGDHQTLRMWYTKKARDKQMLETNFNAGCLTSVVHSPDGSTLASGSHEKLIFLWNAETGVLRQRLYGHKDIVTSVAFTPDGSILASASYDRTIRLWDSKTGKNIRTISTQIGKIMSIAISSDGSTLASVSDDGSILLWKLPTIIQETVLEPIKEPKPDISLTRFSEGIKVHFRNGWISDIAYSSDGSCFAVASHIGTWIYNLHTGTEIDFNLNPISVILRVEYSPDRKILIGRSGSEVYSWDGFTRNSNFIIPLDSSYSSSGKKAFAYSPESNLFAIGDPYGRIQLWDATTGQHRQDIKVSSSCNFLSFSPDGKTIAYSVMGLNESRNVHLWNLEKGKQKQTFAGHKHAVKRIIYAPDGKTIVSIGKNIDGYSSSKDIEILLWDVETGNLKFTFACDKNISTLLYSPDGKTIAGGSHFWIYLWDVATGKIRHKLHGGKPFVYAPDGETLASVNGNNIIQNNIILWDTSSGEKVKTFEGHTEKVSILRYSPDGTTLTSLSQLHGNEIRIWNIDSEK